MADVADDSQPTEELFLNLAIRAARGVPSEKPSASTCEECGAEIQEDRRKAAPGCKRCRDCEEVFESLKKRGLL
jgi:phage/conjugal plasmid C-4 type zinc finger TraR family protein